jgi:hypothetical protein
MPRRMNAGMQEYAVGRMLAGTRWDTEQFDVHAHIDRSLHLGENLANIRQGLGISTRNRGLEQQEQHKHEQARGRVQRQDPNRQTGRWQGPGNIAIDMRFQAMRPGKRFSNTGHRYYERRSNHSDVGRLI